MQSVLRPFLASLLAASAALAETGAVLLPDGFDGAYAPDGAVCEGLSVITIAEGVMVGAEFAISVTDLIEDPVNPRKVEATLLNSGGGAEWTDSAVLELSEDGTRLTFDYPDGSQVVWLRCA
ncbi:MAG: hypothetical protein JNK19_04815 [Tabrizicola sp.]|nr:hypothetical protein [Tabrizicola sp.]